jgi:hypothetical protein
MGMSWGDGCIDLLDFKNSSERLRGEDVNLNMAHGFGAFICHLSLVIPQLFLVAASSRAS